MPQPARNRKPGDTAQLSRTVTDQDIGLFTQISGDRNPLHYDQDAEASWFGEIVVQGGITSAILNAVVVQELPGPEPCFSTSTGTSQRQDDRATPSPATS